MHPGTRAACAALLASLVLTLNATSQQIRAVEARQIQGPTCGAACLFALHALRGETTKSIAEIAQECGFDWDRGINMLAIKKYLEANEFVVAAKRLDTSSLDGDYYYFVPVRLSRSTEYNHFYVVLRKEGKEFVYFDGVGHVGRISTDQLGRIWDGECLVVKHAAKATQRSGK